MIEYESGFALGSFGEHIEATRNIAGFSSRANTFSRPDNMKAFLTRLSILSHIDVWTDTDDLVFNILLLPNVTSKINTYSDYLTLNESEFRLNSTQQNEIREYINSSGRQLSSSEIVYVEPVFDKYVIFVYVDGTIFDNDIFKNKVYDAISKIMMDETFGDVDFSDNKTISRSQIVNSIFELPEVNNVSIHIVSELHEDARINGMYTSVSNRSTGTVTERVSETIRVPSTTNPNIGFTDLGNIRTSGRNRIPIIRGGFRKYNGENVTPITLNNPIYIFTNQNNTWREI